MKTSDSFCNLSRALVSAQRLMISGVSKNAENATFGSRYADLGSVIGACKSALNDCEIFLLQSPTAAQTGFVSLTTRLIHSSGEWLEDTCTAPLPYLDPQGFGSAISYLRRYALTAMMGLYQADDDGESATNRAPAHDEPARASARSARAPARSAAPEAAPAPAPAAATAAAAPVLDQNAAIQATLAKWVKIIATSNADKCVTARNNAPSSFTGEALEKVLQAIAERERVLFEA